MSAATRCCVGHLQRAHRAVPARLWILFHCLRRVLPGLTSARACRSEGQHRAQAEHHSIGQGARSITPFVRFACRGIEQCLCKGANREPILDQRRAANPFL